MKNNRNGLDCSFKRIPLIRLRIHYTEYHHGPARRNHRKTVAENEASQSADSTAEGGTAESRTGIFCRQRSLHHRRRQFAEHGSLDNCREGFMAGLAEEGIEEGVNLTVLYDNSRPTAARPARLQPISQARAWT